MDLENLQKLRELNPRFQCDATHLKDGAVTTQPTAEEPSNKSYGPLKIKPQELCGQNRCYECPCTLC